MNDFAPFAPLQEDINAKKLKEHKKFKSNYEQMNEYAETNGMKKLSSPFYGMGYYYLSKDNNIYECFPLENSQFVKSSHQSALQIRAANS